MDRGAWALAEAIEIGMNVHTLMLDNNQITANGTARLTLNTNNDPDPDPNADRNCVTRLAQALSTSKLIDQVLFRVA